MESIWKKNIWLTKMVCGHLTETLTSMSLIYQILLRSIKIIVMYQRATQILNDCYLQTTFYVELTFFHS